MRVLPQLLTKTFDVLMKVIAMIGADDILPLAFRLHNLPLYAQRPVFYFARVSAGFYVRHQMFKLPGNILGSWMIWQITHVMEPVTQLLNMLAVCLVMLISHSPNY